MAQEESVNMVSEEKKKQLKKKLESIIISAALIVIGLLFCVLPTNIIEIIETIVLIGVLVYGGICMLVYCFTPADFRNNTYLLKAMISLCLGLLLMFVRSFFISAFGLVVLVSGVKTILSARVYKAVGDRKWYMELIAGLVLSVLGAIVIVISNLNVVRKIAFILLGATLIIQGVINMMFMFWLRAENLKEIEQESVETEISENNDETQDEVVAETQEQQDVQESAENNE